MDKVTFPLGGQARWLFRGNAVLGIPIGIAMLAMGEWRIGALMLLGGTFSGWIDWATSGTLEVTDDHVSMRTNQGVRTLRFVDITSARWGSLTRGGLAGLAADNWHLRLEGKDGDKPVVIVLSGPSVQRQAELRELLTKRLPRV